MFCSSDNSGLLFFMEVEMKIAICDDDYFAIEELLKLITMFDCNNNDFEVKCFHSSEKLKESFNTGLKFDIVFLDVELNGKNVIDVAENIKKEFPKTIIILISNQSAYMVEAFKIEALHFLKKPIKKHKFDYAFSLAMRKYRDLHKTLLFKWKNERYTVLIDDILFVEGYHRHIVVHTFDGIVESVGKLSEIYEYLREFSFVRVHQGYLVNMKHIKKFMKNEVVLTDGSKVAISVRKRQAALDVYDSFIRKWY